MKNIPISFEQIWYGRVVSDHIRDFVKLIVLVVTIILILQVLKGHHLSIEILIGLNFILFTGIYFPRLYYMPWLFWMKLAFLLNGIMSGVILILTWILIVIPTAFLLKIIGKKLMDLSFKKDVPSYWEDREVQDFSKNGFFQQY